MTILSMLRVIERNGIFPPGISLSPSLEIASTSFPFQRHVGDSESVEERSGPTIRSSFFLFFLLPFLPCSARHIAETRRRRLPGRDGTGAQGQWQWVSRANRVPRPPKAAPNSKLSVSREGDESRERERENRLFARSPSLSSSSLDERGTSLRSRSRHGDVASRPEEREARVDSGVGSEPVHAGKRTDRPVCEPALTVSPLIATFHARRHASRCRRRCGDLSAPSETTTATAPRRLSSIRRCDADPSPSSSSPPPSVPLPSFHPPTIRPSLQQRFFRTQQRALSQRRRKCYAQPMRNVMRRILQRESFYNALLIQLEQTPDSFRVYIRANGTEASFVKSFASFARASLSPSPPLLLSFAARERKFPRQQLLKLISR